jgi:hypothetical protein
MATPATRRKMLVVSDTADCAAVVRTDALVVATELVTNAMLHGGGCTSLAAVLEGPSLRLEVGDRASMPPQLHHYGDRSATGRGLCLVGALSGSWGWEAQAAGKVVWAAIGPSSDAPPDHAEGARNDAPVHSADEVLVRFGDVPVSGFLALQEQNDAVNRDVDLVLIGWDEGLRSQVPEDLLRLVHEMRSRFGRPTSRHRAAVEVAATQGWTSVDLEEWVSPSSVESTYHYVVLLEQIEAYAGQGHLLVARPADGTVRLRRWFADQVAAQVNGAPHTWP